MANWQLGFGTVTICGNDYWISQHHIRDNSVVCNGAVISVT